MTASVPRTIFSASSTSSIEYIVGSNFDDVIHGDGEANILVSGGGDDERAADCAAIACQRRCAMGKFVANPFPTAIVARGGYRLEDLDLSNLDTLVSSSFKRDLISLAGI